MRERRSPTRHEISWDQDNIRVERPAAKGERDSVSFSWDSILAVEAFKRDTFTVDCICLALETPTGWIEINEEMNGCGGFLGALESSIPGFPRRDKWWHEVAFPAFEENHMRLWTRP